MNFGDILDEWNRRGPPVKNPAYSKDTESEDSRTFAAKRRRRLLRKAPDAVIDLHNLSQAEAWAALDNFFHNGREQGHEKLQVIHGKGNHEGSDGVLREMTRKFIESCPFAGESGYNFGVSGGSGATWVLIKDAGKLSDL
ncbi:MAG: Smr/MutS family protein [Treponema sp.]|nr:Smr/MutS family protein [Treponema sp.]